MNYDGDTRGQNFWTLDSNATCKLNSLGPSVAKRFEHGLTEFGLWAGSLVDEEAQVSDKFPPSLISYSRDGNLINEVQYNSLWGRVSQEAYEKGTVGLNYIGNPAPFAITFIMGYLLSQSSVSLHCPVTMTGAVAYVLKYFAPAELCKSFLPMLTRMDGKNLTGGTWVTERHGGSDVGATTTQAHQHGDHVRLKGLKWFVSNPTGGIALVTARPCSLVSGSKGLGLYLVPSVLADGAPNPMRIRRLKDKLGTRGIATGEVDLEDTWGAEVAPPPVGFKLMMEALGFSRIHNAMSSVGVQRRLFLEIASHVSHRKAFGKNLLSFPMVQEEILQIMINLEAGFALAFEAAQAFDGSLGAELDDADARAWVRLTTALSKYKTANDANVAARSAIELIGGNAYTSDYVVARFLRDAQVLTVWEGPANIQALEVLRIVGNSTIGFTTFVDRVCHAIEVAPTTVGNSTVVLGRSLEEAKAGVLHLKEHPSQGEKYARRLMALLSEILAASLLCEEAAAAAELGDARKGLIARLYIERQLQQRADHMLKIGEDWSDSWFDPLFHYEPIDIGRRWIG